MNANQFNEQLIDLANAGKPVWVVHTQYLENYGSHCEDGLFTSGNAYWKFKGGDTYIVTDLERRQDALAFVAALCINNSVYYKEFPTKIEDAITWWGGVQDNNSDLDDYTDEALDYEVERLQWVTPLNAKLKEAA